MKSLTEHLWFETPNRRDYINITDTVEKLVHKSGVQEGLCLVNAMHITASVFINDDELVEVTPLNIRLRKMQLKEVDRTRTSRKYRAETEQAALQIFNLRDVSISWGKIIFLKLLK